MWLGPGFIPRQTNSFGIGAGLQAELFHNKLENNTHTSMGFRARLSPGIYGTTSFCADLSYMLVPISWVTSNRAYPFGISEPPDGDSRPATAREFTIGTSGSFGFGNHSNLPIGIAYPIIRNNSDIVIIEEPILPVRLNAGIHLHSR